MKKRTNTLVLGFTYPGVEKFLGDFFGSLEKQSCDDFSVCLIDDRAPGLGTFIAKSALDITVVPGTGNIPKNREAGLRFARERGFRRLIIADCDDYYAPDRIEVVTVLLDKTDIAVNEMTLVSPEKKTDAYFSRRFGPGDRAITADMICEANCMGFSNTAVNLDSLKGRILFNRSLTAVDWYFYTLLLNRGCTAVFTGRTTSYYRAHPGCIGYSVLADKDTLFRAVKVKARHYRLISGIFSRYRPLGERFSLLARRLDKDSGFCNSYFNEMKRRRVKYPLWWEEARLPEDSDEN